MWRVVRHDLKLRFYHYTSVQPLTDAHKAQRRKFCQWILEQPSEFVERVVWTDEKFFSLHQKHHRKKTMENSVLLIHKKFAKRMIGTMRRFPRPAYAHSSANHTWMQTKHPTNTGYPHTLLVTSEPFKRNSFLRFITENSRISIFQTEN